MKTIPSFTIDHIRLLRGIYVSRKDEMGSETVYGLTKLSTGDRWDASLATTC